MTAGSEAPFIVVVTGASGAGKTAIVQAVEARGIDGVGCFYFDTIGVPEPSVMIEQYGTPDEWQQAMTQRWIERLVSEKQLAVAVLDGQTRPSFVRQVFRQAGHNAGLIVLVDCEGPVREDRLRRIRGQPELASDRMDSWAAYLRGQADALGLPIIDTTSLTPEEGASALLSFVETDATSLKGQPEP